MVYKDDIPKPSDSPATDSQADFLENFAQLNSQYGTAGDHIDFKSATNNGKHKQATLIDLGGDPVTVADEGTIYTNPVGASLELFYRYPSNGAITQLTWIKAWVRFVGNAASPIAVTDGFNVTNITHAGVGQYTINFTNNLQNANYTVFMMSSSGTANQILSTATNNCVVRTQSLAQPAIVTVLIIGS